MDANLYIAIYYNLLLLVVLISFLPDRSDTRRPARHPAGNAGPSHLSQFRYGERLFQSYAR